MKKFLSVLVILLITINIVIEPDPVWAASEPPQISAETAVLIDATTGKVLYEKEKDKAMFPASTTKIMTAILALENLDMSKTMTIDAETPFTEGARIYLEEGEEILTSDVLKSMLIVSANDSAVALAKEVTGDIPAFAEMMNAKAKEIGAQNTHFANPNGLPDETHVTTAYDLALMARYAMKNQTFREIVQTYQYTIPADNKKEERILYNTNRLIYDEKTQVTVNGAVRPAKYEGATGIKTGFTDEAGSCLVAGAVRDNTELIAVVLKSSDGGRFADSIALLDYGFNNFKSVTAMKQVMVLGTVKVKYVEIGKVKAVLAEDINAILPAEASEEILKTKIVLDDKVKAPVKKGQKIGQVEVYEGDELVSKVDAIATKSVKKGGFLSVIGISDVTAHRIITAIQIIAILLIMLLMIYIAIKRRQVKMRRQRRLAEAERRKREKEQAYKKWSEEYDQRDNPYIQYHTDYRQDQQMNYNGEYKAPDRREQPEPERRQRKGHSSSKRKR